jgi:hypothetical protein
VPTAMATIMNTSVSPRFNRSGRVIMVPFLHLREGALPTPPAASLAKVRVPTRCPSRSSLVAGARWLRLLAFVQLMTSA